MPATLRDYQVPSADLLRNALAKYGVAADGSDTGTGKTYKVCAVAAVLDRPLVVLCPKSVIPDWGPVAKSFGVQCCATNYERIRTGKTDLGRWQVKGKVFEWTLPPNTLLVFDEAHRCGGMQTQNATMLIAAKRQHVPHVLLSATLLGSPLKGYAVGYSLGLHNLVGFWRWARANGVTDGFFGPEWKPDDPEAVMQAIRVSLGGKFTRVRKADVPGFPVVQNIPMFVQTDEMPDLESDYGVEARQAVELLKVDGLIQKAKDLIDDENVSVAIFVNFRATLKALHKAFPNAAVVIGGQTPTERADNINRFQQNHTEIILLMAQAGGTGISLHDLHGRPRAALVCPSHDAVEFLQVLGRIHRDGSLSPALNFIVFASGVPVERRIRSRLEAKLTNLTALNDYDLASPYALQPDSGGTPHQIGGIAENAVPAYCNEPQRTESGQREFRSSEGGRIADDSVGATAGRPESVGLVEDAGGFAGVDGQGGPGRLRAEQNDQGDGRVCGVATCVSRSPTEGLHVKVPHPLSIGAVDVVAPVVPATEGQQVSTTPPPTLGQHVERKHARCSPSKLKNLEICPSYEGDNDGPVHPVTLRGTAMHEALETGDDSKLDPSPDTGPAGTEVGLVTMCREFQDAEAVPGEIVILEPHLKTHDRDVQGFADRVVSEPPNAQGRRKARIRDYKMGWNLVDLPNINPQAIAYTVAVFIEYADVDEVNFAFLIPRLDSVLEHTFHRSELPALKLRLSVIADRVRQLAGKEFNLVESNCLYCGRKGSCPSTIAKMLPIRNGFTEADRLPLPASFDIETLSEPQQLQYMLNLANMAEDWAAKAKSYAMRCRLELGLEIPGYDLIERKAKREVTDPNAAYRVATTEFGVQPTEYLAAAKVSITSLEASVKAHAGQGDKEKAAGRFTDRLMDENALSRGAAFHVLQRSRRKNRPVPALAA